MTTQFGRAYRLAIGVASLTGGGFEIASSSTETLRLRFEIERSELPWPNRGKIEIFNLNPTHRDYLASESALPCILEAGYQGSTGVIFEGNVRQGVSVHDGADWVTTIEAGEGEVDEDGDLLAGKSIRKSWRRGTPVSVVLLDIAKELKLKLGNVPVLAGAAAFKNGPALLHGMALDGPILDELTYFCRGVGLRWSIQGGAIQLRLPDAPSGIAPALSPLTGLVGNVTKSTKKVTRHNTLTKKKEVKDVAVVEGKCLLQAGIQPGFQLILQSEAATGAYLCAKTRQIGDTRGNDWYTEFEGYG